MRGLPSAARASRRLSFTGGVRWLTATTVRGATASGQASRAEPCVERAVEHGRFALRVEVADELDVETELLGPAVLRRPVRRGLVPVQQRPDRGAGLLDGVGPVRGAGQRAVAGRRSR